MVERIPKDLLLTVLMVLLAAVFVLVPPLNETPLRVIFGIPLVLFFPGYALLSALFPGRELDGVERVALSIGLSICLVVFTGLALNYTPWGIRLGPILLGLCGITLFFCAIGSLRK